MNGPSEIPAQPGPARPTSAGAAPSAAQYAAIQASPEYQELRSRYRRFVFPVTGAALIFYFTYVLLAAYASGFMGEKISGNITVGLVFGLLQFVMVFAVTTFYVKFARTTLDPLGDKIRAAHGAPAATPEAGR